METQIFNCVIVATKTTGNKTDTHLFPVICNGYEMADAELAMAEHGNKIFAKEISDGYRLEVKIMALDKQKLRDLLDGEIQQIAGFNDHSNDFEFEM